MWSAGVAWRVPESPTTGCPNQFDSFFCPESAGVAPVELGSPVFCPHKIFSNVNVGVVVQVEFCCAVVLGKRAKGVFKNLLPSSSCLSVTSGSQRLEVRAGGGGGVGGDPLVSRAIQYCASYIFAHDPLAALVNHKCRKGQDLGGERSARGTHSMETSFDFVCRAVRALNGFKSCNQHRTIMRLMPPSSGWHPCGHGRVTVPFRLPNGGDPGIASTKVLEFAFSRQSTEWR